MRWTSMAATIAAASIVVATAGFATAGISKADNDETAMRDLSPQQVEAFKAGSSRESSLRVTASVDRSDMTYAKGEAVKLRVKVNEDAYVVIYNVGPTGKITQLFPNKFQKDGLIKAGHSSEIPPADSKTEIKVTGDTGAELIKFFASNKPIKFVSGAVVADDGVFIPVKESVNEFVRDLEVATSKPAENEKLSIVNVAIKTVASR
jgi:Domain of unknown function (DUF4384)